jgi:hypothetical protein
MLAILVTAIALLASPLAAMGRQVTTYHTISYRLAYAELNGVQGCISTTVWVSSVDGQWAGQIGSVSKQATTDVTIQQRDLCEPDLGKGHPVVFEANGMAWFGPEILPRMSAATVQGRVWVETPSGDRMPVDLNLTWSPTTTLIRDQTNHHGLEPLWQSRPRNVHFGVINTFDHSRMRFAEAGGVVNLDGHRLILSSAEQTQLMWYRWRCQEVVFPHYSGETTWCFGF